MRKIVSGLMISLDGVYQGEEKWSLPYQSAEFGRAVGALMSGNDTLLLGRHTYQYFERAFGQQTGAEADMMTSLSKVVVSNSLKVAEWNNSRLVDGSSFPEAIQNLKESDGGGIGVSGSGVLLRSLLEHGLLDELHLFVFPLVVGTGKRLFQGIESEVGLTLQASTPLTHGVVHLVYTPV